MQSIDFDSLLNAPDTLVLCATTRLAQSLRERHAAACLQAGKTQWATLQCRTPDQWLQTLTDELALRLAPTDGPLAWLPLDATQEALMWERVIRADLGDGAAILFDISAMARSAVEAHSLCRVWNVACDIEDASEETKRFARWQAQMEQWCAEAGWTSTHALQRATVQALREGAPVTLPARVVLAGFNRTNPLEQSLLVTVKERGTDIVELAQRDEAARIEARSYPDADAEVRAVAIWAQSQLQSQPAGQFGIIVPDLGSQRQRLQHALEDALAPHCLRASGAEDPRPFNISLGLPLDRYALVGAALRLLECMATPHQVTQAQLGELLRSPFWSAHATEAAARSAGEAELRKKLGPAASLVRFADELSHWSGRAGMPMPQTLAHLQALGQAAGALRKSRPPSAWAAQLQRSLTHCGWLATRSVSSHEFQTRATFFEVLQALARQDALLGAVDSATALSLLRRLCRERIFQPQTEGKPRLQVLGLLEASGLQLDAVWVMGMTDSVWPPPARPNPLLSAQAQRDAQSPNASATVQLQFARAVLTQLTRAGANVVFSWPRSEGASEIAPSPLLARWLPEQALESPASNHWTEQERLRGNHLAPPLHDTQAPPVPDGENVRGGTSLFRTQAICPAWAFFQYRLGAGRLEEPVEGLDARARGNIVHDCLEHFWNAVKTSAALETMGEARYVQSLEGAVDAALQAHDEDPRNDALQPRFRALERQRLLRLLGGWLLAERKRALPFAVIACEREVLLSIEGIQVKMMIDRIDQLDDGRLLVIDYKTGAALDTRNWASDRITEPQLPIYAALSPPPDGPVAGVAFAKVLMDKAGWTGISQEEKLLPRVSAYNSKTWAKHLSPATFPAWSDVLAHWKRSITQIAQEVRAGHAAVQLEDDRKLPYCDVRPLLRLAERQAQLQQQLNALAQGAQL